MQEPRSPIRGKSVEFVLPPFALPTRPIVGMMGLTSRYHDALTGREYRGPGLCEKDRGLALEASRTPKTFGDGS